MQPGCLRGAGLHAAQYRPNSCLRQSRLCQNGNFGFYLQSRDRTTLRLPQTRCEPSEHRKASPDVGSAPSGKEGVSGTDAVPDDPIESLAQGQIKQAIDLGEEDDMEPLLAALSKAQARAEKMTNIRQANEAEALDIAGMAIAMQDKLKSTEAAVVETQKLIKRREEQMRKLEASRDELQVEEARLSQSDSLASVDAPMDSDAASVGDWDIGPVKPQALGASRDDTELTADAKALTEIQAANMIIKERMSAYTRELTGLQAKLEGLHERVAEAEKQYAEADAAAAAAMRATEGAVKGEMEAEAVYEQVKLAVSAAQASMQSLMDEEEADAEVAEAAAAEKDKASDGESKSVAKAATEEVAKFDIEHVLEEEAEGEAAAKEGLPEPLMRAAAAAVAIAAAVTLAAITPVGPWIAREVEIVGATVAKVTQVMAAIVEKIPWPQPVHGEEGLWETITILFTSVIAVPAVIKLIPGGSAVLGFLVGGAVIGPYGLGLIRDITIVKHLAEMGVVFLLFNIGLELSLERLQTLARAVFGMGLLHFVSSTLAIAGVAHLVSGYGAPCSIVVGGALALSSTAVAMQVLQERGESGTRHGRATFAVLLLQDLAVVVLLMLVPLLANGSSGGFLAIAKALGLAAVKAVVCISAIILAGRTLLRPVMRRIASLENAEMFAATTLLVILGSSALTQLSGLSQALGAFLAGLLMAETEYVLQVESDIAPFKGLLLGLFFISAGMEVSFATFFANAPLIIGSLAALIAGKTALMFAAGLPFGLSKVSALRSGLYIAPGGEFAFVVLAEAVQAGLLPAGDMRAIFFMVVLSMAITPYLAQLGGHIGKIFEKKDVASLQPTESETAELKDHVIIMGFGRVGQTIAQLLSERLIPYVALDVRADRVLAGKAADLPIYFGDAGSPAVLEHVGAARARCAVITLNTPGANYRSVWAVNKNFPHIQIFVRAHDVEHGLNLEKAGATAVVPEILEPSLQLSAAVLGSMNLKPEEVSDIIDDFRRSHMAELRLLTSLSGGSLGYGLRKDESSTTMTLDMPAEDGEEMDDIIPAKPAPA
eukprot:jgi/Ulvmu1/6533/UM003_0166.1